MNVGRMVTLDREGGLGRVVVVDGGRIYRIDLGPEEVRGLDPSLVAGAPIRVEVMLDSADVRFVVRPCLRPH